MESSNLSQMLDILVINRNIYAFTAKYQPFMVRIQNDTR